MAEHIHTHSCHVRTEQGTEYEARVYGVERRDGTWSGWIEFHPAGGAGRVLRTDQETSQPSRRALEYWAAGIEPIYLDGAWVRTRTPGAANV